MERLNKVTLAAQLKPAPKPAPIYISVRSASFGISAGLFSLLDEPKHVEFISGNGNLYLMASDDVSGFPVSVNVKAKNYAFSCKPVVNKFFNNEKQRAIVFTEKCSIEIGGEMFLAYQVKLP